MSDTTETRPAEATPETAAPEWLKTPADHGGYELSMYETDGGSVDNVSVSRSEYVALKKHLATLRGLPWPEETEGA